MPLGDPVEGLLQRILLQEDDATRFSWQIMPSDEQTDFFTLSSDGKQIFIEGNSRLSIASGIGWFLQHYAGQNPSWSNMKVVLPSVLPTIPKEKHQARANLRYYLNFCTHSYTMAFWDWTRWQQEIDLMALHGINLPLITTGFTSVWDRVLRQYGYRSAQEVGTFIPSPVYNAWFLMGNMTGQGSFQSKRWYNEQIALARQIFQRLAEFDITPVVPGWAGMIPQDFLHYARKAKTWDDALILPTGRWNAYERPALLADSLHIAEFAQVYYSTVEHLFGDVLHTHFYTLDPFHEGLVPKEIQTDRVIRALHKALLRYDTSAVWVAQCWEGNPQDCVTKNIPRGQLLLLDLNADTAPSAHSTSPRTDVAGQSHDWIWGCVNNFGGNSGFFGRLDSILSGYGKAHSLSADTSLRGIGYLPEGIETNEMMFDLIFHLAWTTEMPTRHDWIQTYTTMRYGLPTKENQEAHTLLTRAWEILAEGLFNCPSPSQQGPTESVFLMRPREKSGSVSTWANSSWYWQADSLEVAVSYFVQAADTFKENDHFQHDFVDITRQWLAGLGKQTLDSLASPTYPCGGCLQHRFLQLLLDTDTLLGTRAEFRLGRVLSQARAAGRSKAESNLYEREMRRLLTTWGDESACNQGRLHDYANREYAGLLASYYYPRWATYFANAQDNGIDWYKEFEYPFTLGEDAPHTAYLPIDASYRLGGFSDRPKGCSVETALRLFHKYSGLP